MQNIEVLICTIDNGIANVMHNILPPMENVSYLVSWQQTPEYAATDITALTVRKDVRVVCMKGRGLAANRNHALSYAKGDLLIIADDDAHYQKNNFETIAKASLTYPDSDILLFQVLDVEGQFIKNYSKTTYLYQDRPKFSYISSLEIVLKNKNGHLPAFDTRFGLGAEYLSCGEEEVFIHQAYHNGANIRYVPEVITQTRRGTTGSRFKTDVKVRRSKGAVLCVFHGYWSAVLRCLKFSFQFSFSEQFRFFKDMYDGIQYIRKSNR